MPICDICGEIYYEEDYNCPSCMELYREDLKKDNIPCRDIISKENFTWVVWGAYKSLLKQAAKRQWPDEVTKAEVRKLMQEYENLANNAKSGSMSQQQIENKKRTDEIRNLGKDLF